MDYFIFSGVVLIAAVAELIDSSLGMMYGTMLSPLLILAGFEPLVIVPSILFSQAAGGLVAALRHHHHKNADLRLGSEDFKSFLAIVAPGLLAVLAGSILALSIPKWLLKGYIAVLVIVVGAVILLKIRSKFSFRKIGLIGMVSAFNKSLSGGGFGPFVTGGQIAVGQKSKSAIGVTTLAEVPICIASFAAYLLMGNFSDWQFLAALTSGALVGGAIGPRITKKADEQKLVFAVGLLALVLGMLLFASTAGVLGVSLSI